MENVLETAEGWATKSVGESCKMSVIKYISPFDTRYFQNLEFVKLGEHRKVSATIPRGW